VYLHATGSDMRAVGNLVLGGGGRVAGGAVKRAPPKKS